MSTTSQKKLVQNSLTISNKKVIEFYEKIFLSQNTGITSKNNYQIDITNGKILVYVHNCEYMSHKIQIAVDIIDTLSQKIK